MASTAYPIISEGSFTISTMVTLNFAEVRVVSRDPQFNVTGSVGGAAADQTTWQVGDIPVMDFICKGQILSGSDYGLSESGTITEGLNMDAGSWALRKSWKLHDVTTSGNAGKMWESGLATVFVSASGWGQDTDGSNNIGRDFDLGTNANETTVTTAMNQFGTLAGPAKIMQKTISGRFRDGGPIPCSFLAHYSASSTTWSPTGSNFTWLFPSGTGNAFKGQAPEGTLTLDVDASTNIAENVIMYDIILQNNARDGGPILFEARLRADT